MDGEKNKLDDGESLRRIYILGDTQIRIGDRGFAVHGLTTWL